MCRLGRAERTKQNTELQKGERMQKKGQKHSQGLRKQWRVSGDDMERR